MEYDLVFLRRTHRLLALGYRELTPSDLARAQEEDITGELVRGIESVLDDHNAPSWSSWFTVHEEPRLHDVLRRGKRRLRLDIRIDSSELKPRARLSFEAKRLGPGHGVAAYIGAEGLQCFVDGTYGRDDVVAGMLGYVQSRTPDEWALEIGQAMDRNASKQRTADAWRRHQVVPELQHTYRSSHDRPKVGSAIEVYHTFLVFN